MRIFPFMLITLIYLPISGFFLGMHESDKPQFNDHSISCTAPISNSNKAASTFKIPFNTEKETTAITISAAGDCTIGTDESFGYSQSFIEEANNNSYDYFFKNVQDIFAEDDLTIVNLETTFTNADKKAEKKFRFKGTPDYAYILKSGNIELVNIANNHIYDYLNVGYKDTLKALKGANIGCFGFDNKYITEVKGIKLGFIGYTGWDDNSKLRDTIKSDIKYLKDRGAKLVIASFHWGIEREHYPNQTQRSLARYAIDCGADLILGHHPHVMQGIESYKGKNIVYSLGNFSFGGNKNPSDKDTFIYQQTFEFFNGELINDLKTNIIPCSISSVNSRNNYQPTPLEGNKAAAILKRLEKYSRYLN